MFDSLMFHERKKESNLIVFGIRACLKAENIKQSAWSVCSENIG